jgi:hypothetical protein
VCVCVRVCECDARLNCKSFHDSNHLCLLERASKPSIMHANTHPPTHTPTHSCTATANDTLQEKARPDSTVACSHKLGVEGCGHEMPLPHRHRAFSHTRKHTHIVAVHCRNAGRADERVQHGVGGIPCAAIGATVCCYPGRPRLESRVGDGQGGLKALRLIAVVIAVHTDL